jgi:YesN/AraC family two-component response regulator
MAGMSGAYTTDQSLFFMYSEAKEALNCRFYCRNKNIFQFDQSVVKVNELPKGYLYKLKVFERCLEMNDREKIFKSSGAILKEIFLPIEIDRDSIYNIKILFVEVIQVILRQAVQNHIDFKGFISEEDLSGDIIEDFGNVEEIDRYFVNLLDKLTKAEAEKGILYKGLAAEIREYMDRNFCEDLSLNELSLHYKLSQPYLSTFFRRELGRNFSEYLNEMRIDKAKELLVDTQIPILDIALSVGFNDQQYFCRVFKKYTNITPQLYRRDHTMKKSAKDN